MTECLEAYLDLTTEEIAEVDQLLHNEAYQEAQQMGVTTFERGEVSGFRKAVIRLLQARFGDLSEAVVSRLEEMNEPDLNDLLTRITRARSLEELDLNDAQGHESP